MDTNERFEKIEHVTAGLLDERQRDREEYRQMWRDTQRQMAEAFRAIGEVNAALAELEIAVRRTSDAMTDFIHNTDQRFRESDQHFDERIERLVSAIGRALPPAGGAQ